jgi:hypothetical protein
LKTIDRCPHCGQRLPLAAWLRTQGRTLWTTAELVARYGGSEEYIGKEMSRLRFAKRSMRHRLPGGNLSKKRALYCVKPESFAQFKKATPSQLRSWLQRERYSETRARAQAEAYSIMAEAYADKTIPPIVKDRLARAAAALESLSTSQR